MIAEIRLAQGDAAAAVKVLAPYAQELANHPGGNMPMLSAMVRAWVMSGREKEARALLDPLLAKDRTWRIAWLQLASTDIPDANLAAEWVRHVAPMLAADSTDEQVALGSAWYNLSVRGRVEGAAELAAKALDTVVRKADVPADALLLRAAIADRLGDYKTSEDFYRRGLQRNPNHPEAMNNLAYLLLMRGGDAKEARTLAARAVELAPRTASFYDTLARTQAKLGERDAAIASFRKALDLEPTSLEALIGLASVYSESGKRNLAADLMPQIDTLLKTRPTLAAPLRQELEALRATIKASL
jgi:tetratricopeptide (TPR) repeat protein